MCEKCIICTEFLSLVSSCLLQSSWFFLSDFAVGSWNYLAVILSQKKPRPTHWYTFPPHNTDWGLNETSIFPDFIFPFQIFGLISPNVLPIHLLDDAGEWICQTRHTGQIDMPVIKSLLCYRGGFTLWFEDNEGGKSQTSLIALSLSLIVHYVKVH